MVLLQQFQVSKLCIAINTNFTDSKRYSLPATLFICLSVFIIILCSLLLLFSISTHAINLSICLPFLFFSFLFVSVSATYYKYGYTFFVCFSARLYVYTCFSAYDKSSVLVITSEDYFLLCSFRDNYLPGHFAWCATRLPILDCKFCHYL